MKKVLYVVTKANWGGAQRYVYDLATAAKERGCEVAVAFGQPGRLREELQKAGIETHEIKTLQRDVSMLRDVKSFFELRHLFSQLKPDVVHLNSSKAGGVGALAARLARVPKIIFTVHGLPWDENRNPVSKFLIYVVSKLTFLLSHKVITVSEDNHRRVPGSVLIYNGVAPIDFGSGEIIRKAFPPGVKITGTVGELTYNKNQVVLIEEARKDQTMYVAIVGGGELRPMLEQKIKEHKLENRVKLFGFLLAAQVMKGFDRFALPSLKEGLGYVILEARLAGLPITANRVGGVGEALDKDLREFSLEQMLDKTFALYKS